LQQAKADRLEIVQLIPGRYLFEITNTFLGESVNGRLQLQADLLVKEGPDPKFKGRGFFKTWGLDTDQNWRWLVRDLEDGLGISAPDDEAELVTKVAPLMVGVLFEGIVRANPNPEFPPNLFIPNDARRVEGSEETKGGGKRF